MPYTKNNGKEQNDKDASLKKKVIRRRKKVCAFCADKTNGGIDYKDGNKLTLTPHVPSEWNEFTIRYRFGSSTYVLKYQRPDGDGAKTKPSTTIELVDDGQEHTILV